MRSVISTIKRLMMMMMMTIKQSEKHNFSVHTLLPQPTQAAGNNGSKQPDISEANSVGKQIKHTLALHS